MVITGMGIGMSREKKKSDIFRKNPDFFFFVACHILRDYIKTLTKLWVLQQNTFNIDIITNF